MGAHASPCTTARAGVRTFCKALKSLLRGKGQMAAKCPFRGAKSGLTEGARRLL
jgi:hypothetical protein